MNDLKQIKKAVPTLTTEFLDQIVERPLAAVELRNAFQILDATPDGWKRLAIAFLEAQCLNEALAPAKPRAVFRRRNPWPRRAAAAGILAASFALGWFGRPTPAAPVVVAQAVPAEPAVIEPPAAPSAAPSPLDAVEAYLAAQPSAISDQARYLLQQQGYEVDEERKIMTRVLPDGRVILAPVDQVRIRQASLSPL